MISIGTGRVQVETFAHRPGGGQQFVRVQRARVRTSQSLSVVIPRATQPDFAAVGRPPISAWSLTLQIVALGINVCDLHREVAIVDG